MIINVLDPKDILMDSKLINKEGFNSSKEAKIAGRKVLNKESPYYISFYKTIII